jgi:hypothetical protein
MMLTFTDESGTKWDVFEVHPGHDRRTVARVPDRFRMGWLCFQSEQERRRLAPIPDAWHSWDEPTLLAALHTTHGMPRRTPPHPFDAESPPRRTSGETEVLV